MPYCLLLSNVYNTGDELFQVSNARDIMHSACLTDFCYWPFRCFQLSQSCNKLPSQATEPYVFSKRLGVLRRGTRTRDRDKMAGHLSCVVAVFLLLVVGFSDKELVVGLDNGLALTPPSTFYLNLLNMELCIKSYLHYKLPVRRAVLVIL